MVRMGWIAAGALVGVVGSYLAQTQVGRWGPTEEPVCREAAMLRRRTCLKNLPTLPEQLLAGAGEQRTPAPHRWRGRAVTAGPD